MYKQTALRKFFFSFFLKSTARPVDHFEQPGHDFWKEMLLSFQMDFFWHFGLRWCAIQLNYVGEKADISTADVSKLSSSQQNYLSVRTAIVKDSLLHWVILGSLAVLWEHHALQCAHMKRLRQEAKQLILPWLQNKSRHHWRQERPLIKSDIA